MQHAGIHVFEIHDLTLFVLQKIVFTVSDECRPSSTKVEHHDLGEVIFSIFFDQFFVRPTSHARNIHTRATLT